MHAHEPCASCMGLRFDALLAKPGDVVVLRTEQRLVPQCRIALQAHLEQLTATTGVRFAAFDGAKWEACVIGAPE